MQYYSICIHDENYQQKIFTDDVMAKKPEEAYI